MVEIPQAVRSSLDIAHRKLLFPILTFGTGNDRKTAHERAIAIMESVQGSRILLGVCSKIFRFDDPILRTRFLGVQAPNPLGLAAGFDKDARVFNFLGDGMGFGSVTVGSITLREYAGNKGITIVDLPKNASMINRMGFPGEGVNNVLRNIAGAERPSRRFMLFLNMAASKPSFEAATEIADYAEAYRQLVHFGDFTEINVSSPNTEGVRGLEEPERFKDLAQAIKEVKSVSSSGRYKPLIYKFSPDIEIGKLCKNIDTSLDCGASGVSLGNTTTNREIRSGLLPEKNAEIPGGLSGACLRGLALERSHIISRYTKANLPIKFSGGVMNPEDIWNALSYGGASLVDVYTSFVLRETSTPNFSYYMLSRLVRSMRYYGMSGMDDFRELRGEKYPFPAKLFNKC